MLPWDGGLRQQQRTITAPPETGNSFGQPWIQVPTTYHRPLSNRTTANHHQQWKKQSYAEWHAGMPQHHLTSPRPESTALPPRRSSQEAELPFLKCTNRTALSLQYPLQIMPVCFLSPPQRHFCTHPHPRVLPLRLTLIVPRGYTWRKLRDTTRMPPGNIDAHVQRLAPPEPPRGNLEPCEPMYPNVLNWRFPVSHAVSERGNRKMA